MTYLLTLITGIAIAFGLAELIGLLLPSWKLPIFLLVAAWWLWNGWKYAKWRDQHKLS